MQRGIQGWAGGLVSGSGMALITNLFDARLRTRIIAITQSTFTACHLSGPIVGGMFAAMQSWRGSFWMMAPEMLAFAGLACLTALALLPGLAPMTVSALAMGIGIGLYNVHLVARAMNSVASDEHCSHCIRLDLGALNWHRVRRGDSRDGGEHRRAWRRYRTESARHAVTAVYMFCCIPFGLAALLIFRFVRSESRL